MLVNPLGRARAFAACGCAENGDMAAFALGGAVGEVGGLLGEFGGALGLSPEEVEESELTVRQGKGRVEFDCPFERDVDIGEIGEHPVDTVAVGLGGGGIGGQRVSPGIGRQGHVRSSP